MKISEFKVKMNRMSIKMFYGLSIINLLYIVKLGLIDFPRGSFDTNKNFNLVMCVLFLFGFSFAAIMEKSTMKVLDKCRGAIEGKDRVDFSELAAIIGEDVYTIKTEMHILVENEYFQNVLIDENGIYKGPIKCENLKQENLVYENMKCEYCGGVTAIEGPSGVCSYCGAPLGIDIDMYMMALDNFGDFSRKDKEK